MPRSTPTVRRRRLATALRDLREASGKTADEAASELGWSRAKLSRIEAANAVRLPTKDLNGLLDVYGVTDAAKRDELIELAQQARKRGWWATYRDVLGAVAAFEAEAATIRTFQTLLIPGLLQTPQYARALFRGGRPALDGDEYERHVEARMHRKLLLDREHPPEYRAIVHEAALHSLVGGPETMRGQLDALIHAGERSNVQLQVLELASGAHPGLDGAFTLLEFADPEDAPIVHIEAYSDGLYLDAPDDIKLYASQFEDLQSLALGAPKSANLIAEIRDRLA